MGCVEFDVGGRDGTRRIRTPAVPHATHRSTQNVIIINDGRGFTSVSRKACRE